MINNYINNFESIMSTFLFYGFKYTLFLLVILLILSLIFLIVGCIIKSQTIKSKFLKIVPGLLLSLIFLLFLPYILVQFNINSVLLNLPYLKVKEMIFYECYKKKKEIYYKIIKHWNNTHIVINKK